MKTIKFLNLVLCPISLLTGILANSASCNPGVTTESPPGTYTYTQIIDQSSPSPYYTKPEHEGGLGIYSWYNQDYGWQHNFPDWNTPDINIISSVMIISAWDVDSETFHGTEGEYDGLAADEVALSPGLLQGENRTTSITNFDIPLSTILDNDLIDIWLDIDMNHTTYTWATRIDYSKLEIVYTVEINTPPEISSIALNPQPNAGDDDTLTVEVATFDADEDTVTLTYRWYVDVGQGFYVDDEFAGRGNHTGHSVPAADTEPGDKWKVEVTPTDAKGAIGEKISADLTIREEYFAYYPSQTSYNTLAFEDYWPTLGDYDMNDLVVWYRITTTSNLSGQVYTILFEGELVARGAGFGNGFGLSFSSLDISDMGAATLSISSDTTSLTPEAGHSGELVFILFEDTREQLRHNGIHNYYNTEDGDQRPTIPFQFTLTLDAPKDLGPLNTLFFNPFIIRDGNRNIEIHLVDHPPTDLADVNVFSTDDDKSNISAGSYYRSKGNLPWALNISAQWPHPLERVDITKAYQELESWVESNGTQATSWYLKPVTTKTWQHK